ncbi:hypothetical protein FRX31_031335, partial [Thalictrum thalictroides]
MLSPTTIAYQINSLIFKLFGQHDIQAQFSQNLVTRSIWIPPSEKQVKVNVDIAFIIRNCDGDFLLAGTDCCRVASAEEAECKGLLLAVKTGICQCLDDVVFETDNKNAANYLAGIPASLS